MCLVSDALEASKLKHPPPRTICTSLPPLPCVYPRNNRQLSNSLRWRPPRSRTRAGSNICNGGLLSFQTYFRGLALKLGYKVPESIGLQYEDVVEKVPASWATCDRERCAHRVSDHACGAIIMVAECQTWRGGWACDGDGDHNIHRGSKDTLWTPMFSANASSLLLFCQRQA
jgi:hypothetical protein